MSGCHGMMRRMSDGRAPMIDRVHPGLLVLIAVVIGILLAIGGVYGASWLLRTFPP